MSDEFDSAPDQDSVNVLDPTGNLVSISSQDYDSALTQGFSPATQESIDEATLQAKYGTPGQQAVAAIEGAAKGLAGPVLTGLELAGGVKPEDIRGRKEANPVTHGVAEAGTFLGSALLGTGEAALLGEAGKAMQVATGLEKAAKGSRLAQTGAGAARGAFEGILYQSGEEKYKSLVQDPNQTSDSIPVSIGMTGVLGGVFGGGVAALSKVAQASKPGVFVSELDRPAVEAGDLAANVKAADHINPGLKEKVLNAIKLNKEKKTAPDVRAAAKELDDAPIVEGTLLDSPLVQTQLDALANSRYTVAGDRVGSKFDEAYNHVTRVLDDTVSSGPTGSKADIGNALKEGLSNKIRTEYAPIQEGYAAWAAEHGGKEIGENLTEGLKKALSDVPEFRVSPSSPGGRIVKQVLSDIDNVKTIDDLKIIRDGLDVGPMASSQERRMVGILRDKLSDIEEGIIGQKNPLTPVYKKFITKVSDLSEQLGKGKVHGTEDALRFMNERLTAEEVASRIFTKKDSEFLNFFSKEFPEEFQIVRNYQRAEMIERATRGDQGFSPKAFFKNFSKLEPEIQQKLYTSGEIKKINAAETYIREAFPKSFNPSGTAHLMGLRDAYASPRGFAVANIRDYAIEKAIQTAAGFAEGKQAVEMAQAVIKGENAIAKGIKSVFNHAKNMPSNIIPITASRARLDKLVTAASENPERLLAMNDNNNAAPEYNTPLAATAGRVVSFLAQIKPNTDPASPFDSKRVPNSAEKAAYERALDIAEQPLVVLPALKDGRITPTDVQALRSMYPNLYNKLSQKITEEMVTATEKGTTIPYKTKMGLSIFLGRPLDSTMTPSGIINAQPQPAQAPAQEQPGGTAKGYQSKALNKAAGQYQTPEQARAARSQRQ